MMQPMEGAAVWKKRPPVSFRKRFQVWSPGEVNCLNYLKVSYYWLLYTIIIDPICIELIRNVFVPCLFHQTHMKESILVLKLPVYIPKEGEYFVKVMARHVFVQPKRVSSIHHWRCNWLPVTPFRYPNPTSHIKPTTNPPHELTKI